jgi:ubiquinone/menaquinone biosynthesis C-methylase UbiE
MTMTDRNIAYETPAIEAYYRRERIRWDQFYESERLVFEELGPGAASSVLDIGCGCGGLGLALLERFGISNYTGVEINRQAAETAKRMYPQGRFLHGDILSIPTHELAYKTFDVVVSLSCIDWNVQFSEMLLQAYRYVKPGGSFVSTFRLTACESMIDPARSYQYINFEGKRKGEVAPYVVLNFGDFMSRVTPLAPSRIRGVGYWRAPSSTAVTPFSRIVFAAVAIQKQSGSQQHSPVIQLDLPEDLMAGSADTVLARQS